MRKARKRSFLTRMAPGGPPLVERTRDLYDLSDELDVARSG